MNKEIATKHQRLIEYMDRYQLAGLALATRTNFSWLTGGKLNFVSTANTDGAAPLAVTREKIVCVTNSIEQPRIAAEELRDSGIEVVAHPWQQGGKRTDIFGDIFSGSGTIGYDVPTGGLPKDSRMVEGDFAQVRWSLLPEEIDRYRQTGRATAAAMEKTVRQIKPGMTENEIAGIGAREIWSQSARPWVILIAADERIKKFRHPIPTDNVLKNIVEIVFCMEKDGVICSQTRFVSFGAIDADLRKRHQAVVEVDGAINLYSKPGRTLGEMFNFIVSQYERVGFGKEWQLHHQGGPTGYNTRDCIATPDDPTKLVANQALAWNPSITGAKSEDTIIISDAAPIVLTQAGPDWPMIEIQFQGQSIARPDILIVD